MMLSLVVIACLIIQANSHGYISSPRSRNYVAAVEGVWSGGSSSTYPKEDCPQCANIGGTSGQCGVIGGRNYDDNHNVFGNPMPPNPQARYSKGQVISIDVVLTAHHMGHFEFSACPINEGGKASGSCFKKYRLKYVSDPLYGAPRDSNYPYRAYIAPPSISKSNGKGLLYRFRLKLPDNLSGNLVLLQWHYFTANSCIYDGYQNYPFPSKWGYAPRGLGVCGNIPAGGGGLPEQFWNCAEISIMSGPGSAPFTAPKPSATPTSPSRQTSVPIARSGSGTCGNGKKGNGRCANPDLCCSKWGYCGTGSAYCSGGSGGGSTRSPTRRQTGTPVRRQTPAPISRGSSFRLCGGGVIGSGICPTQGHCCSRFGYCGTGSAYCSNSRERSLSTGSCGNGKIGNGKCSDSSLCCSKYGYCGTGKDYCGSSLKLCGGGTKGIGICPTPGHCCSQYGYCGTGSAYCGNKALTRTPTRRRTPSPTRRRTSSPAQEVRSSGTCGNGKVGNGKCSNSNLCCSKWGYCGTGSDYCSGSGSSTDTAPPPTTTRSSVPTPSSVVKSIPFPSYASGDCDNVNHLMRVNVGYYQSWAAYRPSGCNPVSPGAIDVDGNGYTHLIYTFASISSSYKLQPWGGDYSGEVPRFKAFTSLKKSRANLKTLIAVGGWTFNDPGPTLTRFSDTASTASRRATFAKSCVEFCRTYNFDGVDLDWEYPGDTSRGGSSDDKGNFVLLVQAIRSAFDDADEDFQLTMAIPVAEFRLRAGYDLPGLARGVSFFNLMTYDLYGAWDNPKVIGANTDMPFIFDSVKYILNRGVPSNKLVLGLAAYGRTYTLADNSCTSGGCPFSSGALGGCAGDTGFMPYFTIDQYLQSGNYKSKKFNSNSGTMELLTNSNVLISYDSPATLAIKHDFASKSCFRGVMWWAVDMKEDPIVLNRDR